MRQYVRHIDIDRLWETQISYYNFRLLTAYAKKLVLPVSTRHTIQRVSVHVWHTCIQVVVSCAKHITFYTVLLHAIDGETLLLLVRVRHIARCICAQLRADIFCIV